MGRTSLQRGCMPLQCGPNHSYREALLGSFVAAPPTQDRPVEPTKQMMKIIKFSYVQSSTKEWMD